MKIANPATDVPPIDANYITGSANSSLTGEIAAGTAPGGELGGTWASPTVDSTHSGSAHHTEAHTAASHSDTTATGAELNTLTDGSNADSLHDHLTTPVIVNKGSDTGYSSDTTLTDDPALTASIPANSTWLCHWELSIVTHTDPDFKIAVTAPSGVTSVNTWEQSRSHDDSTWSAESMDYGSGSGTAIALVHGGPNGRHISIWSVVVNGSNSGNIVLQHAQNTSSGNATTVKGATGDASFMHAVRID